MSTSRRNFLKYLGLLVPAIPLAAKASNSAPAETDVGAEKSGLAPTREPDYDTYDDDWEDEEWEETSESETLEDESSSSFSSLSVPSSGGTARVFLPPLEC